MDCSDFGRAVSKKRWLTPEAKNNIESTHQKDNWKRE